jgi:signal transduction histidine kinase/ActR/RegA family two-component response regulator
MELVSDPSAALLAIVVPGRRREAALALAQHVGAEQLIIFTSDPELDVLLPAPGFPQTLPDGRAWRGFLMACVRDGEAAASLRSAPAEDLRAVLGIAGDDGSVLVLLGGQPKRAEVARLQALLPLLAAALRGERIAMIAESRTALAQRSAQQANALAEALDAARASLRQALNQVREADQRKDEFLAMLAHELRNPLAPIRNASEVLARTAPGDSRTQSIVGVIRRQVEHMTRLVDDLLDVSRITQGRIELKRETVVLQNVIGQAVESVSPLIRDRRHALQILIGSDPVQVTGDFNRLLQCVVNLLTNAAKYTDPGGHILLEVRGTANDALIEISDSGVGIPAHMLSAIFELFVQMDRTLERSQGGLGIGLSVVRRLIEMHGGEVCAHSEGAGKGSRFSIRLPRVAAPSAAQAERRARLVAARRILIVDDNTDAADTLAMMLQLDGHDVQTAYRGPEALERLSSFDAQTVLLDIGLPGMDGYEVARRMRQQPRGPALHLIALTGYGQPDDHARALAAGFDDHLVKPVTPDALTEALAQMEIVQRSDTARRSELSVR